MSNDCQTVYLDPGVGREAAVRSFGHTIVKARREAARLQHPCGREGLPQACQLKRDAEAGCFDRPGDAGDILFARFPAPPRRNRSYDPLKRE